MNTTKNEKTKHEFKYYLTPEACRTINSLRTSFGMRQEDLSSFLDNQTIETATRTVGFILDGIRRIAPKEAANLYELLRSNPKVHFLKQFAEGTYPGKQYLTPSRAQEASCLNETSFSPFYRMLDNLYLPITDDKLKCQMTIRLVKDLSDLVEKYTTMLDIKPDD